MKEIISIAADLCIIIVFLLMMVGGLFKVFQNPNKNNIQ
jgi:TRAP-type C4-dicarboxylate transport system permease small subunit